MIKGKQSDLKYWSILVLLGLFSLFLLFFFSNRFVESVLTGQKYVFIGVAFLLSFLSIVFVRNLSFRLTALSLSVFIFIGYLLTYDLVSHAPNIQVLAVFAFLLLFLFFSVQPAGFTNTFPYMITGACTVLALYGFGQYFGVFYSSGAFTVKGNFDNPAGFAACLCAGFPFGFSLLQSKRKYLPVAGIVVLTMSAVAIGLSGSRAGLLAITVATSFYFLARYNKTFKRKRGWIILCSIILIGALAITLFLLKKNSALGRLLIWENAAAMIQNAPLLGHSPGSFSAEYMEYQADYFRNHPESTFSQLADNVSHPFNEFLLLIIEYGLIGLILLGSILFYSIRKTGAITVFHLCILSVAVFACFSYPSRYPFVLVLLAYSLAGLNQETFLKAKCLQVKRPVRIAFFILITCGGFFLRKDICFEAKWGKLVRLGSLGKTEEILPNYADLHRKWNRNPLFLYNYGAMLNRAENYTLSNEILSECEKYLNDYDVQMLSGDNHLALSEWTQSENAFTEAHFMIPSRFLPLYHLVGLYDTMDQSEKADSVARIILDKPVKVHSAQINRIFHEMNQRLNQ